MPIITRTVETSLPPEATFSYVADFANIAEWDPGVVAARKVTDGPPGIGTVYSLDLRYGARSFTMRYEIVEWDVPNRVVLEGTGGRVSATDRISFRPSTSGTVVDYEAELNLTGVLRFVQPLLSGLFRDIGDGAASGLADRLGEMVAAED